MSSLPEHPVQTAGFWLFGFLSVVLAVLKLIVAAYWSWWRVMLPLLAFLGHNALYILAGLLCFRWLKHEEEESTTAEKHRDARLEVEDGADRARRDGTNCGPEAATGMECIRSSCDCTGHRAVNPGSEACGETSPKSVRKVGNVGPRSDTSDKIVVRAVGLRLEEP